MNKFAYIRVSTKEQSIDRQILALKPYEVPKRNVYCDYQSGKDFERPAYRRLLKRLEKGDLLIVKSIDRLGRNYEEILMQWQYITKQIQADILVLDMDLLDTRNKQGSLTGTLISDLVLQILAYVAQTERDFIRKRQAEGIAAAREKGKRLGRGQITMPKNFEKLCQECMEGKATTRMAAKRLQLSHTTFYRRYKEYVNNGPAEPQKSARTAARVNENGKKLVSKGRHFENKMVE